MEIISICEEATFSILITQVTRQSYILVIHTRMLGSSADPVRLLLVLGRVQHPLPDGDQGPALHRHPRAQPPHVRQAQEDLGAPEGAQGEVVDEVFDARL